MSQNNPQKGNATFPLVVLFDGECKLCNRSVNIILRIDRTGRLNMASLQSEYGRRILEDHGLKSDPMDSMMLLEGERLTVKSTAVIRISKYLGGAWPLCIVALAVPRFIRDFIYDIIAKNRYRWFGKYDTCPLPDPKFENRFYT